MEKRQCAWCLRLMDSTGERITTLPVPKIYEATHGICRACSTLWLEAVGKETGTSTVIERGIDGKLRVYRHVEEEAHSLY